MSEWSTRDDRQAVARAEYEHIMTTPSPDPSGAFIEAGWLGNKGEAGGLKQLRANLAA